MAFYRGEQGTVKFDKSGSAGISEIAAVRSWSMTIDKEQLETTAHSDNFRKYVGSLISGSGTVEVIYDAPSAGDKLDLIKDVVTAGDTADAHFELYLDETGGKKIAFDGLITNTEYAASVGELEVVTVSFTANGTITLSV
jgi:hypothetical protein